MTVDKGSLLVTLNDRNQNRRNIFRQGVVEQAEEEEERRNKAAGRIPDWEMITF
jgi:hypothetical protein